MANSSSSRSRQSTLSSFFPSVSAGRIRHDSPKSSVKHSKPTLRPKRIITPPLWEATSVDVARAGAALSKRKPSDVSPFVNLKVDNAGDLGKGVFAASDIPRGSLVIEYRGTRISWTEGEDRLVEADNDVGYIFFVEYKSTKFALDASEPLPKWGIARFVNHSYLHPNLKAKVVCVNKEPRLVFFAAKSIPTGEQLLVDYGDRTSSVPWLMNS
ncbi:hypothetical protein GEMRC1_005966 [Eukaryota sp. GEM-RC1]